MNVLAGRYAASKYRHTSDNTNDINDDSNEAGRDRRAEDARLTRVVLPSLREVRMRQLSHELLPLRYARGEPGARDQWTCGPWLSCRINYFLGLICYPE